MAFTRALYYPWIDIKDEAWLKTAALYWDQIQTIVPASFESPYSSTVARILQDEGVLSPLHVNSDMAEIEDLTDDVIKYLNSQVGMQFLTNANKETIHLHPEKLPRAIRELRQIHPMKMPYLLQDMLHEYGLTRKGRQGFLEVDGEFGSFYMTLLATRLAEQVGAGLVTPSIPAHSLSLQARADAEMGNMMINGDHFYNEHPSSRRNRRRVVTRNLAQGMLVELLIEQIGVSPETPIEKIIQFRNSYSSELGRFRSKMKELTSNLPDEATLSAMQQHVKDLYLNEVKPAVDDLKSSLTSNRIKWLANSWMKLACISVGTSSVLAGLGLATGNALLVGAGISLAGSGILYNTEKEDALRSNPYSYLLTLQQNMRQLGYNPLKNSRAKTIKH